LARHGSKSSTTSIRFRNWIEQMRESLMKVTRPFTNLSVRDSLDSFQGRVGSQIFRRIRAEHSAIYSW
jgi:hypothetical protein